MRRLACLFAAFGLLAATVAAAGTVHRERVHFEGGATGTTIRDRIVGEDSIEYALGAQAGQVLHVALQDRRNSVYLNVFAPGTQPGRDAALHRGEVDGNTAEIRLPAAGDYVIQVFQNRAVARRGGRSDFTLRVGVTGREAHAAPTPSSSPLPSQDARVAGTPFHATGTIPCARAAAQPMAQCRFGVVRQGPGAAEVTVFWPDGATRVIAFAGGRPTGAGLQARKDDDLFRIAIGAQRFEIPDAVITGG